MRIIDLESFSELKRLPATDSKCLSVCSSSSEKNTIYAGYSDGTIRKFLDGGVSKRLTYIFQHKDSAIWVLKEIDGFLVSGDSNGDVIIWDKMNGNAVKVFSDFKGDVLTLAVNNDQKTIYASGVDSRVIAYKGKFNFKFDCLIY